MNRSYVEEVARAVLYEGDVLYPYRSSSIKNRQRFTFGWIYPKAYSDSQRGAEPFAMQTECLLRSLLPCPQISVRTRFLHPSMRKVVKLARPLREWLDGFDLQGEQVPAPSPTRHGQPGPAREATGSRPLTTSATRLSLLDPRDPPFRWRTG